MGLNSIKNSVIVFTQDMDDSVLTRLLNYIKRGIKTYLFTTDSLENYEDFSLWNEANRCGLFYWKEIPYHHSLPNEEITFVDGVISDQELFDYICKHANFNAEQYQIEHEDSDKHLIVTAGAGTGKTTVMISRLLFLMHVNPNLSFENISMITFTNEAAIEMRSKLNDKLINYYLITKQKRYLEWLVEANKLQIATIHSFAKDFLQTVRVDLGLSPNISIRSYEHDKTRIIEKLIDQYASEYPDEFLPFSSIPQYHIVNAVMYVNKVLSNRSISDEKIINSLDFGLDNRNFTKLLGYLLRNLRLELNKKKESNASLELDDLISMLSLLPSTDNLKEKLPIRYLMIDEFQDTDTVQVKFVLWLLDQLNCTLFVVGDGKQSIYRFRGADYTAFNQLINGLEERKQLLIERQLVINYRSDKKLLIQLNSLFLALGNRVNKFRFSVKDQLKPAKSKLASVGMVYFTSEAKLKEILKSLKNKDVALLVRANDDVQQVINFCEGVGVFCDGTVQGNFYRTLPVRELYIMIRMLMSHQDTIEYYALHRTSYGANMLSVYRFLDNYRTDRPFKKELFSQQADWEQWQQYKERAQTYPVLALINRIINDINPAEVYAKRLYDKYYPMHIEDDISYLKKEVVARKIEYQLNLEFLLYKIQNHFSDTVATLSGIERFLRLQISTNSKDIPLKTNSQETSHRFKCMTVHKAKGLEFDHVILPITSHLFISNKRPQVLIQQEDNSKYKLGYYLNIDSDIYQNNYYINYSSYEKKEMVAEETRLLYVAATRAKDGLYVQVNEKFAPTQNINSWSDLLKGGL